MKRLVAGAVLLAGAATLAGCGDSHKAVAPPPTALTPTTASVPASTTTSTTVDPGSLPQTAALPSGSDPTFEARMQLLWQAIVTGNAATADPAFFPLGAYIQVKGISDPVHDYQTRLLADYHADIVSLHARVRAGATLLAVSVPTTAQWIKPGVEYNKGSYWRVYGTTVSYTGGSFHVASMISWRGEWYVVHLLAIR